MTAKLRSWWQYIRKHWIVAIIVVFVVLMALIFVGYWFDWTGFSGYNKVTIAHIISGTNAGTATKTEEYQPGKSLWDWLQLLGILAIPAAVGLGTIWFTRQQGIVSNAENKDNQRETALQAYIDKMSELLLDKDHPLRESAPEDEVRKIARVRTLTVLPRLDIRRKWHVLQFLYESRLIEKSKRIVDLDTADLRKADLRGAQLETANLWGTKLQEADLSGAHLKEADLKDADLSGANLSEADLRGANLTDEQLAQVKSLQGATMPDGSKHP